MNDYADEILKRYRLKRIVEHLMGPAGSIILHIVVIVCAIKFMVYKSEPKPADIEVMIMEPNAQELEEFKEELDKIEDIEPLPDDMMAPPDVAMDVEAPQVTESVAGPAEDMTEFAALDIVSESSPLTMKGLYAGRGAAGRSAGLGQYGGEWGKHTEAAVLKALEWLKNHQEADGSWGPNKPAMTGLGILTFLAHGETPSSEKYGQTVEKAIRFLSSQQKETGEFASTDNQPGPYAHAIATYAISEAYGLTRNPAIKPVMEKAVEVILNGQQPGGSWDYKYAKGARRDSSVAAWHIQALKAAYIAKSENQRIKPAMEKAAADLMGSLDPADGRFYYSDKGSHKTDSITGLAVLCLQLMGKGKSKEVQTGLDSLKDTDCDWSKPPSWAMYAWYYITQAKFQSGEGPTWKLWNNKFAPTLVKNQNPDGSWTSPSGNLEQGKEVNNGPVYSTTLAALTLQVYYRNLPTYKPHGEEKVTEKDSDDVTIEII